MKQTQIRSGGGRLAACAVSLCLGVALAGTVAHADDSPESAAPRYELGRGYRLGDTGFTLGGYGAAVYEDSRGEPWRAALDSLSAILWWDGGGRWRFFAELEVDDAVVLTPGNSTADDATLVLERLHLDYAHADALKLRVGKFLTPVGRWNLLHAAPLTWTTSRPLITETTFPTNATGAMLYGVLPWTEDGIEYALYASPGEELFPAKDVDTFEEAWGLRVAATPLPRTQLGLSFASFEQESSPDRKTLYGVDLLWSWRRFELSGEIHYRVRELNDHQRDEYGHYLQLVAPLSARLYGVARYEGFHQAGTADDLHLYVLGVNYRPLPAVVLKAEYSDATDVRELDVRDGFRASIAVMF